MLILTKELKGSILDIGGGGEGVISCLYGGQVTAIDTRREELDGVPYPSEKIVMDASRMEFQGEQFSHATAFYALMYMGGVQAEVLREVYRVLLPGGFFQIWDAEVESAYPDPFLVKVEAQAGDDLFSVTYGVVDPNLHQNDETLSELCRQAGFVVIDMEKTPYGFYIRCQKQEDEYAAGGN